MALSHFQTGNIRTHRIRNLGANVKIEIENLAKLQSFTRLIDNLPRDVRLAVKRGQKRFAELLITQVKKNIRNRGQGLGWNPVSKKYAAWKTKHGTVKDPTKFYQLDHNYLRAIRIKSDANNIYVGIAKDTSYTNRKGTMTTAQYAVIMETGSIARNIEPRPLWRPSYRQIGGNQALANMVAASVGIEWATKYGLHFR